MEYNTINKLSNDIIFSQIEKEAEIFYCRDIKLDNGNKIKFLLNNISFNENIETFSTHSLIKSITLFYCFNKINSWILNFNNENENEIKIEYQYLNYIHNHINIIDFSIFKNEFGFNQFNILLYGCQIIKLNDNKFFEKKYIEFIFDLLFLLIFMPDKEPLECFIKSMINVFSRSNINKTSNSKINKYFFNINLVLFENLFDCILSSYYEKNQIWDFIFNSESIFINELDRNSFKEIVLKYNINISSSESSIDKIKKLKLIHKSYLKKMLKSILIINNNNKNKYLSKFKDENNVINYIFISNYLKDIKKYFKIKNQ